MHSPIQYMPQGLLLFVMFSQLSILGVLLLLLLLQTLVKDRKALRKTCLKNSYIEMIGRGLTDAEVQLPIPGNEMEYDAFAEVAIDVMNSIAGETADRIRQMLMETGVVAHYIRKSLNRSWMKRIYAIERLGLFSLDHLKVLFVQRLATETSYPVRIRLVWSLSRVADAEAVPLITQLLATEISVSSKFNEYIYGNMITSCRNKGLGRFVADYLRTLQTDMATPLSVKKDFIEACGSLELLEASEVIVEYCRHSSRPEMSMSCIRAAGRLVAAMGAEQGHVHGVTRLWQEVIIPGLEDKDWRVRAVAAGAAAACPDIAIPHLKTLLHDANYHVRVNAGKALSASGPAGLAALSHEIGSDDRFARETARYLLQPGRGHD